MLHSTAPSTAESRIIPTGTTALSCVSFYRQNARMLQKGKHRQCDAHPGQKPPKTVVKPPSVESPMVQAVAKIIATTQGRTPARKALTPAYFIRAVQRRPL